MENEIVKTQKPEQNDCKDGVCSEGLPTTGSEIAGALSNALSGFKKVLTNPETVGKLEIVGAGAAIGGAIGLAASGGKMEGAVKGAATGAVAGALSELVKDSPEAQAIKAAGGAVAAAAVQTGIDATRGIAAAAGASIGIGVAKMLENMKKDSCCPGGCCPCSPQDMLKELGRKTWDHITNRPVEAAVEAALAGPAGVVAGAMLRKAYEQKDCCTSLSDSLKEAAKLFEKLNSPLISPLPRIIPLTPPVIPFHPAIPQVPDFKDATKAVKPILAQAQQELEHHRQTNPTASTVARTTGYVVGGPLVGKAAGTALEYADVKARQAYKGLKSLLGY